MNTLTPYIAFDTETGGLNAARCALLSIAAVPSWEAASFSVFIQPEGDVDAGAARVNGYTPKAWAERGAVPLKQAMQAFQYWLYQLQHDHCHRSQEAVAHNAGFDLLFLRAAQARSGIDLQLPTLWHCTKQMLSESRENGQLPPGKNHLNDLGDVSGYWLTDPRNIDHDALQDARCCLRGFQFLQSLPPSESIAHGVHSAYLDHDGGHNGTAASWALFDASGAVIETWPHGWPAQITADFLRAQGVTIANGH